MANETPGSRREAGMAPSPRFERQKIYYMLDGLKGPKNAKGQQLFAWALQ